MDGGFRLMTDLRRGGPPRLLEDLTEAIRLADGDDVYVDLSLLDRIDSLGASLLSELVVRGHVVSKNVHFTGISDSVESGLSRYYYPAPDIRLPKKRFHGLEKLGEKLF